MVVGRVEGIDRVGVCRGWGDRAIRVTGDGPTHGGQDAAVSVDGVPGDPDTVGGGVPGEVDVVGSDGGGGESGGCGGRSDVRGVGHQNAVEGDVPGLAGPGVAQVHPADGGGPEGLGFADVADAGPVQPDLDQAGRAVDHPVNLE